MQHANVVNRPNKQKLLSTYNDSSSPKINQRGKKPTLKLELNSKSLFKTERAMKRDNLT